MKDKVVILARVSTNKQDYDRQVIELTEYCNRVGWDATGFGLPSGLSVSRL